MSTAPKELVLECWVIANALSDNAQYAAAVKELLPFLPDPLVSEVFGNPRPIWSELLKSCTQRITETLAVRLWEIGTTLEYGYYQSVVRESLAPLLPEAKIRAVLRDVTDQSDYERARVIEAFPAQIPADLIEDAIRAVGSSRLRKGARSALVSRMRDLPLMAVDRCTREILASTRAIDDPHRRADALLSLLPWLDEDNCRAVLTEILSAIGKVDVSEPLEQNGAADRCMLLGRTLPYLYGEEYRGAYLWAISEARSSDWPHVGAASMGR